MGVFKIFTIKDGDIRIHREVILTFPSFKKVLTRDRDTRKNNAFKEFCYIYHIADLHSLPNRSGYEDKEAHKYAIEKSSLKPDYKPDRIVLEAIADYREEQSSVARDTIMELLKIFRQYKVVIQKVRASLDKMLQVDTINYDGAVSILNLIKLAISEGREIPIITRELRKAITELEIDEGQHDIDVLRGTDSPVPMSADVDADY